MCGRSLIINTILYNRHAQNKLVTSNEFTICVVSSDKLVPSAWVMKLGSLRRQYIGFQIINDNIPKGSMKNYFLPLFSPKPNRTADWIKKCGWFGKDNILFQASVILVQFTKIIRLASLHSPVLTFLNMLRQLYQSYIIQVLNCELAGRQPIIAFVIKPVHLQLQDVIKAQTWCECIFVSSHVLYVCQYDHFIFFFHLCRNLLNEWLQNVAHLLSRCRRCNWCHVLKWNRFFFNENWG